MLNSVFDMTFLYLLSLLNLLQFIVRRNFPQSSALKCIKIHSECNHSHQEQEQCVRDSRKRKKENKSRCLMEHFFSRLSVQQRLDTCVSIFS